MLHDQAARTDAAPKAQNQPGPCVTAPRRAGRRQGARGLICADPRIGGALTVIAAGAFGLIAGAWIPRGPITTSEALATIAISLLVGGCSGIVMRSRWAMLLAPVSFAAVFELARIGAVGPTVDQIHPGSTYGILAFAVGRGFHGILALAVMGLGAALGAAAARRVNGADPARHGWATARLWMRRGFTGLVAVGLLALALAIIRPARKDAILGVDGKRLAGSVAELTKVEIGGHDPAMMIRGNSASNPVLLFLAGGPGGTEMGAMRRHGQALERDFVVATFDQRGSGTSIDALEPASSLTLDRAVSDTLEVTDYLRERFGHDKIYVVGNSWWSILGVLAAQRRPELYRAFVGAGQMVSPRATDRIFYADTLAWARRTGNTAPADKLVTSGPPPYEDISTTSRPCPTNRRSTRTTTPPTPRVSAGSPRTSSSRSTA